MNKRKYLIQSIEEYLPSYRYVKTSIDTYRWYKDGNRVGKKASRELTVKLLTLQLHGIKLIQKGEVMDSGFDSKDADFFFRAKANEAKENEIDFLKKENLRLLEIIAHLQKDGFTYDQVNRKILVCEVCFKQLYGEVCFKQLKEKK